MKKSITTELKAQVGDYVSGMKKAAAATDKTTKSTEGLSVSAKKTEKKLLKTGSESEKAGDKLLKMGSSASSLGAKLGVVTRVAAGVVAGVAAVGAVAGTAAIAISKLVDSSSQSSREFVNLARPTKLAVDDFRALTIATDTLGISAEQFSDISKDLSDKLGEFGKVGTGAFQDFVDIVGITKEQGQDLAIQFQDMSSDKVLGHLVRMMENAGASGNEMTFVLESLGSDLSKLLPLLAGGGDGLEQMKNGFKEILDPIKTTQQELDALAEAATAFNVLSQVSDASKDKIAAQFAPAVASVVNWINEQVPKATAAIVSLINAVGFGDGLELEVKLPDPQDIEAPRIRTQEELTSGAGNDGEMTAQERADRLAELYEVHIKHNRAVLDSDIEYYDAVSRVQKQAFEEGLITEEQYNAEIARLTRERAAEYRDESREGPDEESLEERKAMLEEIHQAHVSNNQAILADEISFRSAMLEAAKEARQQDLISEEEFQEMFQELSAHRSIESEAERLEQALTLRQEHQQAILEGEMTFQEAMLELQKGARDQGLITEEEYTASFDKLVTDRMKKCKEETKDKEKCEKKKTFTLEQGVKLAKLANTALFEDNKAVNAGLIIADTAAAIMASLKRDPYDYGNVAVIAATGAVQLANALSSSPGGGGNVSGPSGGSGTSIENPRLEFDQETTDLDIGFSAEGEVSTVQRVAIDIDQSEEFLDGLADRVARNMRSA